MVNGELYENTAMGIPVSKSFHLEKTYTKGQVNRDKGYNFTNVNGLFLNKQVWAYPINMDTIQQVLDNDTANPKWIGKVQYATPTILYPKTCKIILEKQPSQDEITAAKSNLNKTFRVPVDYLISASKPESKPNNQGWYKMNLLILRVLTLLVSNLENKPLISKFVNLINRVNQVKNKILKPINYISDKYNKITNKVEDIYQWLNPSTYVDLIKKGHKKEIQQILSKLEKDNNIKNREQFKNENYLNTNWQPLNSSWLDSGMFNITNKLTLTGNLTILIYTKTAKHPKFYGPYVYPSVPVEIWKLLSNAVSNAGTLFWRYWLRKWLPSHLRDYIKKRLPQALKEKYPKGTTKLTLPTVQKLQQIKKFINNLKIGHFNFNFAGEINNKKWYRERRSDVKNIKNLYKTPFKNMFYKTNQTIKTIKKTKTRVNSYKPSNLKNKYRNQLRGVLYGK